MYDKCSPGFLPGQVQGPALPKSPKKPLYLYAPVPALRPMLSVVLRSSLRMVSESRTMSFGEPRPPVSPLRNLAYVRVWPEMASLKGAGHSNVHHLAGPSPSGSQSSDLKFENG